FYDAIKVGSVVFPNSHSFSFSFVLVNKIGISVKSTLMPYKLCSDVPPGSSKRLSGLHQFDKRSGKSLSCISK
ncbi:hypothetical protein KAI46_04475, partial [bacterium]|nr:hypothetical protein [bacterium]